jgi:hypothetical protein
VPITIKSAAICEVSKANFSVYDSQAVFSEISVGRSLSDLLGTRLLPSMVGDFEIEGQVEIAGG